MCLERPFQGMAAKKKPAGEKHVGTVEHYYPKVQAAAVKLDGDLKVGDTIHIQGHSDDYTEKVTSMQLDHAPVAEGHAGQSVGVGVPVKVHEHSEVLKVAKAAKPTPKKVARKAPKKPARKAKRAKKAKSAKRGKKAKKAKGKRKAAKPRRRAGKRPARRSR